MSKINHTNNSGLSTECESKECLWESSERLLESAERLQEVKEWL